MSLFRTAIILSAGIALMPSDEAQQEQLYSKVAHAAYWTATFCDRNLATCENASQAWDVFVKKAEFAGKVAYDLAQQYSADESGPQAPAQFSRASAGTLQPETVA